ncbi:ABC-type transporter, periplasmic subunit family 3 [Rhizobium sp. CF080]|uniref:transporter substrate-binding domain-containing protein n=1 Tax=Rhizobium sp. (strain CF080) TaxID=1144310 RepID=UPI000271AC75|nr:transporter substrate-binding domain-containing protein [Rhizobium sp. CF080]EUB98917.1 ABC-type transporter, periplasmic subunit family 3 [Rhizobium sp. CF080]
MKIPYRTIQRVLASAACAAAVFLQVPAQAQELPPLPAAIKSAGVLRFGVKCDSPPFGSTGSDGKPMGIEVEMAKQIATYAFGSPDKAELTCVTSEARIPSLNGGKIDLILATLGKFPAREEVIDFSAIYFWGTSNVIVPKDSPVHKLSDFAGKTILIVKGGSQIKWLQTNIPDVKMLQLNTTADGVQALQQERGDGFVGDGGLIWTLASNYPALRVIDEGLDLGVNGIGLRKNEPELKAFVNAALARLKADKFYDAAAKKFIDNDLVRQAMLKGFTTEPPALK